MEPYKLRVKIGDHEFDAEGPQEAVGKQFQSFKDLIASLSHRILPTPIKREGKSENIDLSSPQDDSQPRKYDNIFKAEGRVVSLTALPQGANEAGLLILLGQKLYRNNDTATGSEIVDGLEQSGYTVERADRLFDGFIAEGLVIKAGKRRAIRYRLANQGLARAEAIAQQVQGMVA